MVFAYVVFLNRKTKEKKRVVKYIPYDEEKELKEKRRITPAEIEKWFTPDNSAYGAKMSNAVGNGDLQKIVNLLIAACDKTSFDWKSEISFFIVEANS